MQELINKQQIAERKQNNLLQRIQQFRDSRTPAQQNPSIGATNAPQTRQTTPVAGRASQTGQTTAGNANNGGSQPPRVRFQTKAGNNPQPTSAQIDTKKPIMGGLVEGHCGKEAWTGWKPNCLWDRLENPDAVDFLQPTQMQSSSAKAAAGHLKHIEGIFLDKACRFKTGEDLDDLHARLETHFKKHGMDTITCRNDPNEPKKVVSVFNSHPPFTIESMKVRNFDVIGEHDTCDEQNNDDAIECFMNSLREDLRQQS